MKRTHKETVQALMIQRAAMAASCSAYDGGDKWEALRLATSVYTIVHDQGKMHSILSQLKSKHKLLFVASGPEVTEEILRSADRFTPLIELEIPLETVPQFVPILTLYKRPDMDFGVREIPFDDWWEKDIIFFEGPLTLTRDKLVSVLRNQEGGSHFDRQLLNPNYMPLRQGAFMFIPGKGLSPMTDLELATMRQVAEELVLTLYLQDQRQPMWLAEA